MKIGDLRETIYQFQNDICYFSQMKTFAMSLDEQNYYQNQIDEQTDVLIEHIKQLSYDNQEEKPDLNSKREYTIEELSTYDGSNGKAAYVAVKGNVYDLSNVGAWGGGMHFGLIAGKDLSAQFMKCHQGMLQMLDKLPKVGVLK